MNKKEEIICQFCNEKFMGIKGRKYCSYNCSHSSRKIIIKHICLICNKSFETQKWNNSTKYCSFKCKSKAQSSNIIAINCDNCNKSFNRKEHLITRSLNHFCCKKCSDEYHKGLNHYEWKEFLHDKHIKLALKQWSILIKERDKYICKSCGETNKKMLEAHHIIPKSLKPELIYDINNGITLCLECHLKEHINDIKSSRLIKYKIDKLFKNKENEERYKENIV